MNLLLLSAYVHGFIRVDLGRKTSKNWVREVHYHFKCNIEEYVPSLGIFFPSVQIKKGGKPLNPFSGYVIHPSSFIPQMTGFTGIVNYYVNELFFF